MTLLIDNPWFWVLCGFAVPWLLTSLAVTSALLRDHYHRKNRTS